MEFIINTLKSKEIDIYISFVMTILGAILGVVFNNLQNKDKLNHKIVITSGTVDIIKNIENNSNYTYNNNHREYTNNSQEVVILILYIIILLSFVFYLFNINIIINAIRYIYFTIISFAFIRIIYIFYKKRFSGFPWFVNITFHAVLYILMYHSISRIHTPINPPRNFFYTEQIVDQYGLKGLIDYFDSSEIVWLLMHSTGIFVLFIAILRLGFSTIYVSTIDKALLNTTSKSWLLRAAEKRAYFRNSIWWNILLIFIISCIANSLISGELFAWFYNEFPIISHQFIHKVIFGNQ